MWVPYLLRSPERSLYSNGPKTTLGAGFGSVPIAGLRLYHNTLRFSEFRVEVRFKAKGMDCDPRLSYSEKHEHKATLHKSKHQFYNHHEHHHLFTDGGHTFDGCPRRPGSR